MMAATKNSTNCQVLNISNVNHKGEVVLNDERLLELIQQYPFLFNPRVHPFGDDDYNRYAWENIRSRFQANYESKGIKSTFSIEQLQDRWKVLQPIIKSLAKLNDISSVPSSLRQVVTKMTVQLEDQITDTLRKPLTSAQRTILENIDMVKHLPMNYRKQLEGEMMDLLLSAEIGCKGTVKLGPTEKRISDMECRNFLTAIHSNEIIFPQESAAKNTTTSKGNNSTPNSRAKENTEKNKTGYQIEVVDSESNDTTIFVTLNQSMLEPMPPKRFIPLNEARFHVRRCKVKLKRLNMEDYVPLSVLKKSKIKTEC